VTALIDVPDVTRDLTDHGSVREPAPREPVQEHHGWEVGVAHAVVGEGLTGID
jgi:hypothetical protein